MARAGTEEGAEGEPGPSPWAAFQGEETTTTGASPPSAATVAAEATPAEPADVPDVIVVPPTRLRFFYPSGVPRRA